jgi:hypothetical protein
MRKAFRVAMTGKIMVICWTVRKEKKREKREIERRLKFPLMGPSEGGGRCGRLGGGRFEFASRTVNGTRIQNRG